MDGLNSAIAKIELTRGSRWSSFCTICTTSSSRHLTTSPERPRHLFLLMAYFKSFITCFLRKKVTNNNMKLPGYLEISFLCVTAESCLITRLQQEKLFVVTAYRVNLYMNYFLIRTATCKHICLTFSVRFICREINSEAFWHCIQIFYQYVY